MPRRDPRIDAYIARSAAFARPILEHLRALVHRACPDVVETIKWSMPAFEHHGPLANMAAFKAHCTFGFWRGSEVVASGKERDAMGQLGRLVSLADLPADRSFLGYVKKAAELNEKHPKPEIALPEELVAAFALREHARARASFEGFSPSHRREYVEWIVAAKRPATRARRVAQALEWLAEGKHQNWKYERR